MPRIIRLFLLLSCLSVTACLKSKQVSIQAQCAEQITLQQKRLTQIPLADNKKQVVTNLITAAKILQQHNSHSECLNKIIRAKTILDQEQPQPAAVN